jgi:hypothetical protein
MLDFQLVPTSAITLPALLNAKKQVWPHENCDPDFISSAVNSASHHSAVILESGLVAAFVDGFLTHSKEGKPRWEVDLLGTLPQYRGQGLARRLIEDNLRAGWQRGAVFARALIQVSNTASQRAFTNCGFSQTEQALRLWVCAHPVHNQARLPENQCLIPVETFNYQGVWLEGELDLDGLRAARAWLPHRERQICGVLIPSEREDLLAAASAEDYLEVGEYQWWDYHWS